jgi:hypothetical protein
MKNLKQHEKLASQTTTPYASSAPTVDFLEEIVPKAPLKPKHAGGRPPLGSINENNDLEAGKTYNEAILVENTYRSRNFFGKSYIMADCLCLRCGNHFTCRLQNLKSGHTRSCGCLKKEVEKTYAKNTSSKLSDEVLNKIGPVYYGPSYNVFVKRKLAGMFKIAYFVIDWAARLWKEKYPEAYLKVKAEKEATLAIKKAKQLAIEENGYIKLPYRLFRVGGPFGPTEGEESTKRWNEKHKIRTTR